MDGDVAWTEVEVRGYKPIKDKALDRVYLKAGMESAGPEERAQYLMSRFLTLNDEDNVQIARASAIHGKPAAMKLLEQMAIKEIDKRNGL